MSCAHLCRGVYLRQECAACVYYLLLAVKNSAYDDDVCIVQSIEPYHSECREEVVVVYVEKG